MPVPKRKRSRRRRDMRFANKGLELKSFNDCPNCNKACLPHQVCKECGFYKGTKIIATKSERISKRNEIKKIKKDNVQKEERTE